MTWIDKLRSGVSSLFRKRKRSSPPAAAPASPPPPASTARPPAPLRGRIEREVSDTLAMYLDWLQRNYAMG